MPRVFVLGATLPMGGSYMAYHIGRLLHLHYGYEFVNVTTSGQPRDAAFTYDIPMRSISGPQMEKSARAEDIMVINPSYSHWLFGLRLPGRKIMYIQDFKTFQVLDCQFDLYVCVSSLVQRYLQAVYGMQAPVIPAFIHSDRLPAARPWEERPGGSALVYVKHPNGEHRIVVDHLQNALKKAAPQLDLSDVFLGRKQSHREFLSTIGSVRYLVHISLVEGFGLVPLEAMALGTAVTGLDGLGGCDYMKNGENCMVGSIRDLRALPGVVQRIMTDEALARACVAGGFKTATAYGYETFKKAWLAQLSAFLGREPAGA